MSNTFYTNVQSVGGKILYRGYEDGIRVQRRETFEPKLYIEDPNGSYQTISGKPAREVTFDTISHCYKYIRDYEKVSNFTIYGNSNFVAQFIHEKFPGSDPVEYDRKLVRCLNIDIETESESGFSTTEDAEERINVITIRLENKKWILGLNPFFIQNEDPDLTFQKFFIHESDLLTSFISIFREIDPDVVFGWNIRGFDIPYLVNRIKKVLGESEANSLSPWGTIEEEEYTMYDKPQKSYIISGVEVLDYLEMYRKYANKPLENYKLDTVAEYELGEKKVDYSSYGSMKDFYNNNFQKFVEYNVQDVNIVSKLDNKLNLIDLHLTMSYLARVNYKSAFQQVSMWDSIIYNDLITRNIVIPPKVDRKKSEQYAGAYVKEPNAGLYDWVVSFDLASLYPHLIMQHNISPDTIISEKINIKVPDILDKKVDTSRAKDLNCSLAANGHMFTNSKRGFLPLLMEKFYKDRKTYKKMSIDYKKKKESEADPVKAKEYEYLAARYDTMQQAMKISLNSAYGAIGNEHFRHYDIRQAEAITLSGQCAIQWIQKKLNAALNTISGTTGVDYTIASDTDSIYLNMATIVKKNMPGKSKNEIVDYLDKFCAKVLSPFIEKSFAELSDYLNSYAQKMEMKREVIADRGIWKAKKMYALNVHDSEGVRYSEPQLKIMGLETQRSSTPKICRKHLKNCIKTLLLGTEDEMIASIEDFKKEFYAANPEDIAKPTGVKNLAKYEPVNQTFVSGTPAHVKAAHTYNRMLEEYGISRLYESIGEGDKIKYVHLKMPNPTKESTIAFVGKIPPEFNLKQYVDYDTQFEKMFLDPITSLLDVAGWKSRRETNLFEFFV